MNRSIEVRTASILDEVVHLGSQVKVFTCSCTTTAYNNLFCVLIKHEFNNKTVIIYKRSLFIVFY